MSGLGKLAFAAACSPLPDTGATSSAAVHVSAAIDDIDQQLQTHGLSLANVCRLLVHYVPKPGLDRQSLPALLTESLNGASPIALTLQPVSALPSEKSVVSILAVAVADGTGNALPTRTTRLPDSRLPEPFYDGVACAGFVFISGQLASVQSLTAGLVAQNADVLKRIATVLDEFELTARDIIKFNTWRAPPPDQSAYQAAAEARFDFLRGVACAVTGIPVTALDAPDALIHIDVWAAMDNTGVGLDPPGHWDWPAPNPYVQGVQLDEWLFVGGQASLDEYGQVVFSDDLSAQQTHTVDYVRNVLAAADDEFELEFSNTYYCPASGAIEPALLAPVTTLAGVKHLAYPGQVIEIEGIARRRRQ